MNIDLLRDNLKVDEGYRTKAYKCSEGHLTIGVGWNLDVRGLPPEIIEQLLTLSIEDTKAGLNRSLTWWGALPETAQRGLCNLTFCVGVGGVLKFTKMLAALKSGDFEEAAVQVMDSLFAKQTGARARRIAELFRDCK
jgi:lysozyme